MYCFYSSIKRKTCIILVETYGDNQCRKNSMASRQIATDHSLTKEAMRTASERHNTCGVHLQYLSYTFISPEVSRKDFVPDIEQADIRPLYTSRPARFLLQDPSGEIFWVTRDLYGCFMGQTAFLCL
ncbi:hypothetical protein CDAR_179981 [Caerostris darwini]|uniref:Uncharacterized protein n=1 Tax=Caerostris darwini TaxID=1538125 RepID=A0AAV4SF29_9ARAC|nr:hypothetical protein CDAR_179981 [Caerostris darwini]